MAWSDAARAAALEARRNHAAKGLGSAKQYSKAQWQALTPKQRVAVAMHDEWRRGGGAKGYVAAKNAARVTDSLGKGLARSVRSSTSMMMPKSRQLSAKQVDSMSRRIGRSTGPVPKAAHFRGK